MSDCKKRPVIQHMSGPDVPPEGTLAPYEIGIGYETVLDDNGEKAIKITLYTSTDGNNILPIGGGGSGITYEIADEQYF